MLKSVEKSTNELGAATLKFISKKFIHDDNQMASRFNNASLNQTGSPIWFLFGL